jgi:trans-aconitate methyltransferase
MSPAPEGFNPHRFRSTVPYYVKYRLTYPDSLVARVAEAVGLKPGEQVMDLGCGPGQLAISFAKLGMRVVAIDPEQGMLTEARAAAAAAGVDIDVRLGSSFDLPADTGPYKLVVMGRAFHWMDRVKTLVALDGLIEIGGAVALFHDAHPTTAENAWLRRLAELKKTLNKTQTPPANPTRSKAPAFRTHESLLMDSAFSRVEKFGVYVKRQMTTDDLIGLMLSESATSPEVLGDKQDAFVGEYRKILAGISPGGQFTEIAELFAQVAWRR